MLHKFTNYTSSILSTYSIQRHLTSLMGAIASRHIPRKFVPIHRRNFPPRKSVQEFCIVCNHPGTIDGTKENVIVRSRSNRGGKRYSTAPLILSYSIPCNIDANRRTDRDRETEKEEEEEERTTEKQKGKRSE